MKKILEIENLAVQFKHPGGVNTAVENISIDLEKGEILGLVGESGSGKTVTAHAILNLINSPPGIINSGKVLYQGEDLLKSGLKSLQKIRGKKIAIIFQELLSSLNPVFCIGQQLIDVIRDYRKCSKSEAYERSITLLKTVGISDPKNRMSQYPNQLSGGLRQRLIIAMAIAAEPEILIADEPTTALDVTIQAQILRLFQKLSENTGCSIILITHDLGIMAKICKRVVIMFNGLIMENIPVSKLLKSSLHPYTLELLAS